LIVVGCEVARHLVELGAGNKVFGGKLTLVDGKLVSLEEMDRIHCFNASSDLNKPRSQVLAKYLLSLTRLDTLNIKTIQHENTEQAFDQTVASILGTHDFFVLCTTSTRSRHYFNTNAIYFNIPWIDVGVSHSMARSNYANAIKHN